MVRQLIAKFIKNITAVNHEYIIFNLLATTCRTGLNEESQCTCNDSLYSYITKNFNLYTIKTDTELSKNRNLNRKP
jgi:hypothetical protein